MSAKTLLSNHFIADEKPMFHIPRKVRAATDYVARAPLQTKIREVVVAPDNSRVELLEKKTMDMSSKLLAREEELKNLHMKLLNLESQGKNGTENMKVHLQQKEQEIKDLKARLTHKQEAIESLANHANKTSSMLTNIHADLSGKDGEMNNIKLDLQTKADIIGALQNKILEKDGQIVELSNKIQSLHQGLTQVHNKQAVQEQEQHLLKVKTASSSNPQTLWVGPKTDLPKQPEAVSEGGVWKSAPGPGLVVSGTSVLFHDIGYTSSKKGTLPLVLDLATNRVLVDTSGK